MTPMTMFFVIVGVAYVSAQLVRFIVWLDTPKGGRRHEKA